MKKVYKNKKSLSAVIVSVILILLVTVATALVWTFVRNMVNERTSQSESCFKAESSELITINDYYTCFNSTRGEVQFSLSIGDINVDNVLISILAEGNTKTFTLTNENNIITNLRPYKENFGVAVKLPGKNEGLTYSAGGFSGIEKIDWIKIAPVINEKQCESTDSSYQIEDCSLLAS